MGEQGGRLVQRNGPGEWPDGLHQLHAAAQNWAAAEQARCRPLADPL